MTDDRRAAILAVCATILAARKLATVPRNSPAYVSTITDAIADARRILASAEQACPDRQPTPQLTPARRA